MARIKIKKKKIPTQHVDLFITQFITARFGYNMDNSCTLKVHFRLILLNIFTFYSRYDTDSIANMDILSLTPAVLKAF